jgi:hypothetical protein
VDLLDAQSTEIRATFFKEAVDKFEPMLQVYFEYGSLFLVDSCNFCRKTEFITSEMGA